MTLTFFVDSIQDEKRRAEEARLRQETERLRLEVTAFVGFCVLFSL